MGVGRKSVKDSYTVGFHVHFIGAVITQGYPITLYTIPIIKLPNS